MSSNDTALRHFLARLTLRSRLAEAERMAILSLKCEAHAVRANYDVVKPGQKTNCATLVGEGLVGRFDQMRDGGRQLTAVYIRGDMCDLHSVVAPIAGWGLMALTEGTVLRVPHAELRELAVTYPAVAFAFWRDTTVDASILSKWIGNIGRREARARIAHLICGLGLRMEAAGLGTRTDFPFPITQNQLADMVGVTSVHVNRTLQDLRRDGVIVTDARRITVPDWEHLCRVADFDPTYLLLPD